MPSFKAGDSILVRCEVRPGPFSDENLITIETVNGEISGFVRDSDLIEERGEWYVRGVVRELKSSAVRVRIRGSFLTTNGIADVSASIAKAA